MNVVAHPRAKGRVAASAAPAVSVVMVVYFTGPALERSLRRVLDDPRVEEFVLVDNGSTGLEAAALDAASRDKRVKLLRGHGNIGFARGANLGARTAKGRDLVFLNPDAFLEPGCVASLVETLEGAPAALVGARVLNEDGQEQRGARRGEVTPLTTVLSLTGLARRVGFLRRFEIPHEGDDLPTGAEAIPTVSGACFAMRREAFEAVGGFDEGYFLHVEDVDLCWRVRKAGGAVLFQPAARVVHPGSTSQKSPVAVEYWKGLGLARYFRKRASSAPAKAAAWLLFPAIVGVSVFRALRTRRARR